MKPAKSTLIVALGTIVILIAVELASNAILRAKGKHLPLFMNVSKESAYQGGADRNDNDKFRMLDPHLGYAHGENETNALNNLKTGIIWRDGFAIYGTNADDLQHPVILALGGSTTDGVMYGHSWPEELAKLLRERNISATVINGGTGGYSTNQELLKLIRDGLGFKPDIVISFSGVNDRGIYGEPPYPMVHRYQRSLLATLAQKSQPPFMPNSVSLLQMLLGIHQDSSLSYTYGAKSSLSQGGQYKRNIELMEAVSRSQGAKFIAIIQPNAFYQSKHRSSLRQPKVPEEINAVQSLYADIATLPNKMPFVRDATGVFEQHEDIYKDDGIHVTAKGDRIIAEYIFKEIKSEISKKSITR